MRALYAWAADPDRGGLLPEGFRNPFLRATATRGLLKSDPLAEPDLTLPMAIDLGTTIVGNRGHDRVVLVSQDEPDPAEVELNVTEPAAVTPKWARYVAAVVAELAPPTGFIGKVSTTIPIGTGLSSSAALEVAVALALVGDDRVDRRGLALACQRAEHRASGVPCDRSTVESYAARGFARVVLHVPHADRGQTLRCIDERAEALNW